MTAPKGPEYVCPSCHAAIVLRKGAIRVPHFAHKPPTDCSWAAGETAEHREAKIAVRNAFRLRGFLAEFEVEVLSIAGDRRADVLVTSPDGLACWGIEIQHSPLLYPAIEARTRGYMAAQIPVLWMGILSEKMRAAAEPAAGGLKIDRYSIRPWEKWASALNFGELWYVDASTGSLWQGTFGDYLIHREATSWYETGGVEQSTSGYSRRSKRWRTLLLKGPFSISQLWLAKKWRRQWSSSAFALPEGHIATLVTA